METISSIIIGCKLIASQSENDIEYQKVRDSIDGTFVQILNDRELNSILWQLKRNGIYEPVFIVQFKDKTRAIYEK